MLTGTSGTLPVQIDVRGVNVLRLQVLDAGDGNAADHADWASAFVTEIACPSLAVTTQPDPVSTCPPGSALFTVAASGTAPFTYSWRKGVTPLDTVANPSAATATLTIAPVRPEDAGDYSCVVTDACGSTSSNAAALTVCFPWGLKFEVSDDGGVTWKAGVSVNAPQSIKFRFGSYFDTGTKVTTSDGTGNALVLNRFTGQNQWVGMGDGDSISGYTRTIASGNPALLTISGGLMGSTAPTSFGSQQALGLDPDVVQNYTEICRGTLNIVSPTIRTLTLKNKQFGSGGTKGLTFYNDASITNRQAGAPIDASARVDQIATIEVVALPCPADFNHDSVVDDADFLVFVVAYELLLCGDPAMPAGCPSDLNADGFVDDSDFQIFGRSYDALVCP